MPWWQRVNGQHRSRHQPTAGRRLLLFNPRKPRALTRQMELRNL